VSRPSFIEDIEIDEHRLDAEWLKQPSLILQYSEDQALAKKRLERARQRVDRVKAETFKDICKTPSKYGLTKTTVDAMRSAVDLQPEVKAANDAVAEAVYQAERYRGVLSALDHKKKALENLVTLYLRNYYSDSDHSDMSPEDKRLANRRVARTRTMKTKINKE